MLSMVQESFEVQARVQESLRAELCRSFTNSVNSAMAAALTAATEAIRRKPGIGVAVDTGAAAEVKGGSVDPDGTQGDDIKGIDIEFLGDDDVLHEHQSLVMPAGKELAGFLSEALPAIAERRAPVVAGDDARKSFYKSGTGTKSLTEETGSSHCSTVGDKSSPLKPSLESGDTQRTSSMEACSSLDARRARHTGNNIFEQRDSATRSGVVDILDVWKELGGELDDSERPLTLAEVLEPQEHGKEHRLGSQFKRILGRRTSQHEGQESEVFRETDEKVAVVVESDGCCRHLVLHPYCQRRTFWDISGMLLVLYDSVMIPMGFFELPENAFLTFMAWVTRFFWTFDMPMSFLSGCVTHDGAIEMRPPKLAKRYLKSWFALDCLVVGIDWLEILAAAVAEGLGFARMSKVTRIFRILRMIRLLRLARMKEVFALLMERFDNEKTVILVDVTKLVLMMAAVGHMLGCTWYLVGTFGDSDSEKNWLAYYGYREETLEMRYVMSLRWAMSQFGGGMDEVTPKSFAENIFASLVYVMSFWSGAVFLSILTSSMTQLYLLGSQNAQHLTTLRRYLSQHKISKTLALRVSRNAQHAMLEAQKHLPEAKVQLMGLVSEPLRVEMHSEMYSPVLSVHPFFVKYMEHAPPVMRKVCHSAMSLISVSEGDVIFNFGETPTKPKMLLVNKGTLSYVTPADHDEGTELKAHHWISEATLWTRWVHRGTLSAVQDSRLYALDAKEFQQIVIQFQHSGFNPRDYATSFVADLNEADEPITDLPTTQLLNLCIAHHTGKQESNMRRQNSLPHGPTPHTAERGVKHGSDTHVAKRLSTASAR